MSLCVFLSPSVWHHCSPALPIVPVAPQPEATQARSNSRRHTMQTADKNRMDMCRPRLALILGHTLKIESEKHGPGMGRCSSTWLWNYLLGGKLLCLCIYRVCVRAWMCVCVCVCVCVSGLYAVSWEKHSGEIAALSQQPIPGERDVCLPCLMLHTANSHWVNYCGRLFSHHNH